MKRFFIKSISLLTLVVTVLLAVPVWGETQDKFPLVFTWGWENQGRENRPLRIYVDGKNEVLKPNDILYLKVGMQTIKREWIDEESPVYGDFFIESPNEIISWRIEREKALIDQGQVPLSVYKEKVLIGSLMEAGRFVPSQSGVKGVKLEQDDLLDPLKLALLDGIYMDNVNTQGLSQEQANGLLAFVGHGGRLFLKKGPFFDKLTTGVLAPFEKKNKLTYGRGQIICAQKVPDAFLESNDRYPSIRGNRYRAVAKKAIQLDWGQRQLFLILLGSLGAVGIVAISLIKKRSFLSKIVYLVLVCLALAFSGTLFNQPLAAMVSLQWESEIFQRQINYFHGDKKDLVSCAFGEEPLFSIGLGSAKNQMAGTKTRWLFDKGDSEKNLTLYREGLSNQNFGWDINSFSVSNGQLTGQVEWKGPHNLNKAVAYMGSSMAVVGTVGKGQTVNFDMPLQDKNINEKPYERMAKIIDSAHWSAEEARLFDAFQNWYLKTETFTKDRLFLIGLYEDDKNVKLNETQRQIPHKTIFVKEILVTEGVQ